jgi:vacuolar-type H+-ATPase subunit H
MNWTEIWTQISPMLQDLLIVAVGVACTYAIKWLNAKKNNIEVTTSNQIIKKALDEAEKVIDDCVKTTNQTFVDSIKGTDKWDKKAMEEAFDKTKDSVLKILSEDTVSVIKDTVESFDAWLKANIESSVATNK